MTEDQPRPSFELPILVLAICAFVTVVFVRMGNRPLISGSDVVLHGGWSFLLMLGGCFALRNATGVLAKGEEWMIFLGVLSLGLGLEVVQYYWRIDSTVGDIAIDAVGATAGWAFWHVCVAVGSRQKRKGDE